MSIVFFFHTCSRCRQFTPAPNTDGIDPDSTKNVLIENCVVQVLTFTSSFIADTYHESCAYRQVGDDSIAIKSGMDYAGRQFNRSTENVIIRNSW